LHPLEVPSSTHWPTQFQEKRCCSQVHNEKHKFHSLVIFMSVAGRTNSSFFTSTHAMKIRLFDDGTTVR
jgi:hypothetical protein